MHKWLQFVLPTVLIAAVLPNLSRAASSKKGIAWDKVIGAGVSDLTASQKSRVEENLLQLKNTHGCQDTLAACMAEGDFTARRHAGFVIRMVKKGKDDAYIAKYLALRHESAHPKEIAAIDVTDRPVRGNKDAPVTIIEFECFQCPFCAHLAPQLKELDATFGKKIVEYFKFYPLRSHPRGVASALAALAAHRQGRFWLMYDRFFQNRADLEDDDIEKYAEEISLNMDAFKKSLKDPSLMKALEKDKLEGMRFGVDGTPTFFINGKRYQALYDVDEIKDRIGEELDILEGRIPK